MYESRDHSNRKATEQYATGVTVSVMLYKLVVDEILATQLSNEIYIEQCNTYAFLLCCVT